MPPHIMMGEEATRRIVWLTILVGIAVIGAVLASLAILVWVIARKGRGHESQEKDRDPSALRLDR